MLVINRFRDAREADQVAATLLDTLAVLSRQIGFLEGAVGRSLDEPGLWVLQTRWEGVGAYRRALSSYDVKVHAWPVLGAALDEPGAFELVTAEADLNRVQPRGGEGPEALPFRQPPPVP